MDFLATIHALNYKGQVCGKVELAAKLGWSKRTVERVANDLVEQGVLTRTGGKGHKPYQYEFTGVYHGREGVMVYVHPEKPSVVVIQGGDYQGELEITD